MRGHQPAPGQRSLFTPQQRHWKQINALQIPKEDRARFGRGVQAGNVFAVLQCMYRLAEKNPKEECSPSAPWLSAALHISEKTVRRAWKVLSGMGLLIAVPRFHEGRETSSAFRFVWSNFPAVEEIDQGESTAVDSESVFTPGPSDHPGSPTVHPPGPGDHPGGPTVHPNQDLQDSQDRRPVGAVDGDLNRLREMKELTELNTVAARDRFFEEVIAAGGFGLTRTSDDRLDFHALVASVVRMKRENVVHSPVGFLLHRISRGPEFWRKKVTDADRKTAMEWITRGSGEMRPEGTEVFRIL